MNDIDQILHSIKSIIVNMQLQNKVMEKRIERLETHVGKPFTLGDVSRDDVTVGSETGIENTKNYK